MCGLAGAITKSNIVLTPEQRMLRGKIIGGLLVANEVRGSHSTGVGIVRGADCRIEKQLGAARIFVAKKSVKRLLRSKYDILIGHTRLATHGEVSEENAHPFREGSILGAHNGIISNYRELDPTSAVDSQALLRSLDRHGNDFQTVFNNMAGSCALTWYDFNHPELLYLVAHYNPINIAVVSELESIFWSSEKEHLETVLTATVESYVPRICLKECVYKINTATLEITREDVDFGRDYYAKWFKDLKVYRRGWPDDDEDEACGVRYGAGDSDSIAEHLRRERLAKRARITAIIDADTEKEAVFDRNSEEFANLVDDVFHQASVSGCSHCGEAIEYECWYDWEEEEVLCRNCKQKHEAPDELIGIDLLNDYPRAQEILNSENDYELEGEVMVGA